MLFVDDNDDCPRKSLKREIEHFENSISRLRPMNCPWVEQSDHQNDQRGKYMKSEFNKMDSKNLTPKVPIQDVQQQAERKPPFLGRKISAVAQDYCNWTSRA
ncbi:unnamed protein product [Clavelina lepadiformis]|uniref:Uncharacterized protein n=1 Tax=Clavelina lepadiformis TaxID=159417 RepID=A0ABP0FBQ2_CLALP